MCVEKLTVDEMQKRADSQNVLSLPSLRIVREVEINLDDYEGGKDLSISGLGVESESKEAQTIREPEKEC